MEAFKFNTQTRHLRVSPHSPIFIVPFKFQLSNTIGMSLDHIVDALVIIYSFNAMYIFTHVTSHIYPPQQPPHFRYTSTYILCVYLKYIHTYDFT